MSDDPKVAGVGLECDLPAAAGKRNDAWAGAGHHSEAHVAAVVMSDHPEINGVGLERRLPATAAKRSDARAGHLFLHCEGWHVQQDLGLPGQESGAP